MSRTAFTIILALVSPFFSTFIHAQDPEREIKFRVVTEKKENVPYYTLKAINYFDSTDNFTRLADSSGLVILRLKINGRYAVTINSVNYLVLDKNITIGSNDSNFTFTATTSGKTLETAVITAQRPLMRQEDDKTIVDPENLAASSSSGFEVIEKTPGLFVDQDGNIYISSLTPAAVQINGRDMKMSAADVATMLKSLPPGAISRIEIIRTPSAKYDATSSGGIVNVVLKKGIKIGLTGSANAGVQQGNYGNQFGGFNLNNNNGKISSSLTLNYSKRNRYEKIITDRNFAPDSLLSQNAFTKYPANVYFISYSIAFPLAKKWDLDFSTSTSLNDFQNETENVSTITKISTQQILTENLNRVMNEGNALNFRSGLAAKRSLDSLGSEWSNDIFFNYSRNKNGQDFTTFFSIPQSFEFGGDGNGINHRNHLNLQSDLKLKLRKKLTIETGIKASFLTFNSKTDYFTGSGTNRVKDISRTNTFKYTENINSAYVQGSKTFGDNLVLKAGTRLENTNMDGQQVIPYDTSFTINRTDLFPYVYLSKNLIKMAGFNLRAYLIYRRTITRPVYEQLNPFPRYIDPYLSEAGNPSLRPQFTKNYEANISVDEMPILAIGTNETKDIFTNVIYQADSSQQQAYRTYDNLGKNKEWYLRALGAIPPGKRYFFVVGAQYNHNYYQGIYEKQPLAFKKGTWTFFTYQTFKIDKLSVITINGFMRLKGQQQFYELTTFGALNGSVNRRFLKEKLIVTLSINDMFFTNRNNFVLSQGSVKASGARVNDTRRVGLSFRYNFGLKKREDPSPSFPTDAPVN